MATPSNGITADVFRELMPPYHLSADLVHALFDTLPPPPPDATPAWRQARITRLLQEVVAAHPADAGQARLAAQTLTLRELADTVVRRAHAPDATVAEMCRLARTAAELVRAAGVLDRSLVQHQQKPVPFFGTVIEDEVDLAAVDAAWGASTAAGPASRPPPPARPGRTAAHGPAANAPSMPDAAPPTPAAARPAAATPTRPEPERAPGLTRPVLDRGVATDWTFTQLDSGPGWTREVLRHRSSAGAALTPAAARPAAATPDGATPAAATPAVTHAAARARAAVR